jgi:glycosyltransferase involved in cell wall biosynthesis
MWVIRRPGRSNTAESLPPVSVVVCVHQDVTQLSRLVDVLLTQKYPEYEIVVVNDGPNAEITAFLNTRMHDPRMRVVDFRTSANRIPGKKAPLSAGIQAAKHQWLLLTDGDCLPGPEWISGMMTCTVPEFRIVLGVAPFFQDNTVLNAFQRFDNMLTAVQYLGAAIRKHAYMGVGRNLLYHKSLFVRANGFSKHARIISGDDDLFVQEVTTPENTATSLHPETFVYSHAPGTLRDWLHQKHRHLSASHAYSTRAKLTTTVFSLSWIVAWVFFPFMIIYGWPWYLAGIAGILLYWGLFAKATFRLRQQSLLIWFPLLAIGHCLLLVVFAVLLTFRSPRVWTRS